MEFNININDFQIKQFEDYMHFLLKYNEKVNLTAITEPKDVIIKHFVDSLLILKLLNITNEKIIDIGTGAGFPGIPLKILKPKIDLTLLDSVNKKVVFLNELSAILNIKIRAVHNRAEEFVKNSRESFDIVTARAVAPLNILAEYCLPYVKQNGCFIALKGSKFEDELNSSVNAIKILGGKTCDVKTFELPKSCGTRTIIVIKKVGSTPKKYPRISSKIIKDSLL